MITKAICSVNGISSHSPFPQASTTCGKVDGVQANPATTTISVAKSAKTKASGTQRSVQSVSRKATRASQPGCSITCDLVTAMTPEPAGT